MGLGGRLLLYANAAALYFRNVVYSDAERPFDITYLEEKCLTRAAATLLGGLGTNDRAGFLAAALGAAFAAFFATLGALGTNDSGVDLGMFVKTNEEFTGQPVSMDLHPEVRPVFRKDIAESLPKPRITRPYYTKYEYTSLLATRAQQLAEGAKPLVALEGLKTSDPMFVWNVARREIEQRKLPFVIRRQLPDNTSEFWSTNELEVMW